MKRMSFKSVVILIAFAGFSFTVQAQSALPYVLASAGGAGSIPNGATLNFTLGEPFITTIGTNPTFTEGFQQPSTSGMPLPIYLLDFSGIAKNEYNVLSWHTAQEKNNDYFDVERSRDGILFYSIGRIYSSAANGNSNEKIAYVYPDKTMPTGINYYRLKQVDKEGQSSYSFIISLERSDRQQTGFTLSPNPTTGKIQFSVTAFTDQSFIQITDINGKKIKLVKLTANITEIDLSGLADGAYFIRYIDGQNSSWTKVIKK